MSNIDVMEINGRKRKDKSMLSPKSLIAVFGCILLIFGCQFGVDLKQERADLLQADWNFAKASIERGAAEAFNMYLADDAMQMPEGKEPVIGRGKIYERMKNSKTKYELQWEPQGGDVAKSRDLGWTWGKSTVIIQNEDGTAQKFYGKYLNVWKKQSDGSWKVLVDIGNENPTPEGK